MQDALIFPDSAAFRAWLEKNGTGSAGVWLLFGKKGGPATLTAPQALEEALCYGWIDGQMQSLDDTAYKKYFAPRRAKSKWSEKNKALAQQLESQGRMTGRGRAQMEAAKKDGRWDVPKPAAITEEQIAKVAALLEGHEPASTNFAAMSPSVQRTYTRAYLDAKTPAGQQKRLAWMIERLDKNLKPM